MYFSKDEEERQEQIKNLEKEREETDRVRKERKEQIEKRKEMIREKKRAIQEKRSKGQAERFLDNLGEQLFKDEDGDDDPKVKGSEDKEEELIRKASKEDA
jgi:hypothetical protein